MVRLSVDHPNKIERWIIVVFHSGNDPKMMADLSFVVGIRGYQLNQLADIPFLLLKRRAAAL